jgi:adenylate cyclase
VLLPYGVAQPPVSAAIAYLPSLPEINDAARGAGYFGAPSDPDTFFRSEVMVIRFGNRYCDPLILGITSAYAGGTPTTLKLAEFGVDQVTLGSVNIPVDEQGRMQVNFRGPAHTFPYYSASDVIAHRVAAAALSNKIVLVGASATGLGDVWPTPMGYFPGVEIHANAIDNILGGDLSTALTSLPAKSGWWRSWGSWSAWPSPTSSHHRQRWRQPGWFSATS